MWPWDLLLESPPCHRTSGGNSTLGFHGASSLVSPLMKFSGLSWWRRNPSTNTHKLGMHSGQPVLLSSQDYPSCEGTGQEEREEAGGTGWSQGSLQRELSRQVHELQKCYSGFPSPLSPPGVWLQGQRATSQPAEYGLKGSGLVFQITIIITWLGKSTSVLLKEGRRVVERRVGGQEGRKGEGRRAETWALTSSPGVCGSLD